MAFTVVFPSSIKKFDFNPMTVETPFGTAQAISYGDALSETDLFREALERIAESDGNSVEIAEQALEAADKTLQSELAALSK